MTKFSILFAACAVTLSGQRVTDHRSAEIQGGGGDGKCTIEVVVDDVAEVEVRGAQATIRTISGSPATFRRFQCNQELPNNPVQFRFQGIDGRGRQSLVSPADNGRPAVIRIEDSKGGSEGYTFDILWQGTAFGDVTGPRGPGRPGDRDGRPGRDIGPGNGGGWNGWGEGAGWSHSIVDFSGPGGGVFRDRNGNRGEINFARVRITSSGDVTLTFDTRRGRKSLSGTVDHRERGRIFARVNGSGIRGTIEIEMDSERNVRQMHLEGEGELNWSH